MLLAFKKPKEYVEYAVNAFLLVGLAIFSISIIIWSVKLMQEYEVSLEVICAFIGAFLMVLGFVIAKLFSKD